MADFRAGVSAAASEEALGPLDSVVPVVVSEEALVSLVAGLASVEVEVSTVISPVVALASEE